ncbi:MAG: hypothetical protein JWR35_3894 [Marmoricola sp.]|nr:hypothetical protein [Marmoricola sp.]
MDDAGDAGAESGGRADRANDDGESVYSSILIAGRMERDNAM